MRAVRVEKEILRFAERGEGVATSDSVKLENLSDSPVTYKMKTTDARSFAVRPNLRVIEAKGCVDITIVYNGRKRKAANPRFQLEVATVPEAPSFEPTRFWAARKEALKWGSRRPEDVAAAAIKVKKLSFEVEFYFENEEDDATNIEDKGASTTGLTGFGTIGSTFTPIIQPARHSEHSGAAKIYTHKRPHSCAPPSPRVPSVRVPSVKTPSARAPPSKSPGHSRRSSRRSHRAPLPPLPPPPPPRPEEEECNGTNDSNAGSIEEQAAAVAAAEEIAKHSSIHSGIAPPEPSPAHSTPLDREVGQQKAAAVVVVSSRATSARNGEEGSGRDRIFVQPMPPNTTVAEAAAAIASRVEADGGHPELVILSDKKDEDRQSISVAAAAAVAAAERDGDKVEVEVVPSIGKKEGSKKSGIDSESRHELDTEELGSALEALKEAEEQKLEEAKDLAEAREIIEDKGIPEDDHIEEALKEEEKKKLEDAAVLEEARKVLEEKKKADERKEREDRDSAAKAVAAAHALAMAKAKKEKEEAEAAAAAVKKIDKEAEERKIEEAKAMIAEQEEKLSEAKNALEEATKALEEASRSEEEQKLADAKALLAEAKGKEAKEKEEARQAEEEREEAERLLAAAQKEVGKDEDEKEEDGEEEEEEEEDDDKDKEGSDDDKEKAAAAAAAVAAGKKKKKKDDKKEDPDEDTDGSSTVSAGNARISQDSHGSHETGTSHGSAGTNTSSSASDEGGGRRHRMRKKIHDKKEEFKDDVKGIGSKFKRGFRKLTGRGSDSESSSSDEDEQHSKRKDRGSASGAAAAAAAASTSSRRKKQDKDEEEEEEESDTEENLKKVAQVLAASSESTESGLKEPEDNDDGSSSTSSSDAGRQAEILATIKELQELVRKKVPSSSSSSSNESDATLHNGTIASTPPNERAYPAADVDSNFGTEPTERSYSEDSRSGGRSTGSRVSERKGRKKTDSISTATSTKHSNGKIYMEGAAVSVSSASTANRRKSKRSKSRRRRGEDSDSDLGGALKNPAFKGTSVIEPETDDAMAKNVRFAGAAAPHGSELRSSVPIAAMTHPVQRGYETHYSSSVEDDDELTIYPGTGRKKRMEQPEDRTDEETEEHERIRRKVRARKATPKHSPSNSPPKVMVAQVDGAENAEVARRTVRKAMERIRKDGLDAAMDATDSDGMLITEDGHRVRLVMKDMVEPIEEEEEEEEDELSRLYAKLARTNKELADTNSQLLKADKKRRKRY